MKIAIVHDAFMQWGGAENLVLAMHQIWPQADIYTTAVNPEIIPSDFPLTTLNTSFIQDLPLSRKLYQPLFFLQPLAFEQIDFGKYDVVLSSTSKFAKSVITGPQTVHICYCNTPARMVWYFNDYLQQRDFSPRLKGIYKAILTPVISQLRIHDYIAAQKVDYFIANSHNVANRIRKYYHRDSAVIYPFVDLEKFKVEEARTRKPEPEDYYLIVSRLSGHKRVDLAIESFNKLGDKKLIVIGTGSEEKKYRRMANKNIKLLGWVSEPEKINYLEHCRAFIYPQEEDFGITALETQATGKPVIAYSAGGVLETVVENETGLFFKTQTPEALIEAIDRFETMTFESEKCKLNASKFSKNRFQTELKDFVEQHLNDYRCHICKSEKGTSI